MKLTQADVENAAFWELDVCLECEVIVKAEGGYFCPHCNQSPTLPAAIVMKVLDVVEREDSED